ncbi:MAG: DUF4402 domain-containing protein [Bacteroidota bacterium]
MAKQKARTRWGRMVGYRLVVVLLLMIQFEGVAQEMPPRPTAAFFLQNMAFGAFALTLSGGTVTVSTQGARFATGGVILVNQGELYFPAIFGLQGNPGTIVHVLFGPDAVLTGSNGGSMTLHLEDSYPRDPIIINVAPPGNMQIMVGGTLNIGNLPANPPGHYSGSFSIMFIQE